MNHKQIAINENSILLKSNIEILVVEDNRATCKFLEQILTTAKLRFHIVHTGSDALKFFATQIPEVILLDITLPDASGFDICRQLKENPEGELASIIVLTNLKDDLDILHGFQAGAVDFLSKPIKSELLLARVHNQLKIAKLQRSLKNLNNELEQTVETRTRELAISEQRLSYALDALEGGVWDWNLQTNDMFLSKKWSEALGLEGSDPNKCRTDFKNKVHPDDIDDLNARIDSFIGSGEQVFSATYRIRGRNNSYLWCLDHGRIVERDKAGRAVRLVGTSQDITHQVESDRNTKNLEKQVFTASKMESLGVLAGELAHEFNNLLAIGYGLLDVDKTSKLNEKVMLPALHTNLENLFNRGKHLVEQILLFSNNKVPTLEVLDLNAAVMDICKHLQGASERHIEVEFRSSQVALPVKANETQLYQIIANLFTNAKHAFGDKNGHIKIELSAANIDDIHTEPNRLASDRFAHIRFEDDGTGMDEVEVSRAFEPFFSTKKKDGGSGMGLAIVHGIVASYGGFIRLNSIPNEFTRFDIYLPISSHEPEEESHKIANPSSDKLLSSKETRYVLFVDDEDQIVKSMRLLFPHFGFDIIATNSAEEALRIFRKDPDKFVALITDQSMPEMTGVELIAHVRKVRDKLPVILLTGRVNVAQKSLEMININKICVKPMGIKEIVEELETILEQANSSERLEH